MSGAYSRLIVGDQFGTIRDELQVDIEHVSWRINNIGECKFKIATTDPKATESNIRYGNRIMIEFSNGLPDWGGVIDPPRSWAGGAIEVTAYSGEYLFGFRITDKGRYFTNQTVGEIYRALIEEANAIRATGVIPGYIYDGGIGHSPDYHLKSLLEIFQKSLTGTLSTYEFNVTPTLENGKIIFYANLYEQRGMSRPQLALIQGRNMAPIKLQEQGPIVNSWTVAGAGTGWGDERLTATAEDGESVAAYGLREDSQIYSDVSIQSTLQEHVTTLLDNTHLPHNIFTISAIDEEPATFNDYDVGDEVSLLAESVGFGGTHTTVRILAREYNPGTNVCGLVVEEVLE